MHSWYSGLSHASVEPKIFMHAMIVKVIGVNSFAPKLEYKAKILQLIFIQQKIHMNTDVWQDKYTKIYSKVLLIQVIIYIVLN